MRPSYRPEIPPEPQAYRTQVLDPLGLVAGMFEARGITAVMDKATQQAPELRIVTAGHAVQAMVLNALGFIHHQLSLVPHFFQHKPRLRLIAPGMQASHLNDDPLGRAFETLYAYGVTELSSLIATTAAQRRGLAPTCAHLASTSVHGDGRDHKDQEPEERVMHITRGSSREQRPDRNQVMLALIVEHQAGIPVLRKPLSGNSSETHDFGQIIKDHRAQLQRTSGTLCLVADSALSRAANLQKLAETRTQWITRVPATLHEAQTVLARAEPQTMAPLTEESRYPVVPSTYGGVEQRWVLLHSEPRQPQAPRTVDKQLRQPSAQEVKGCKQLCRTAFACAAEAPQALASCAQDWQATCLATSTERVRPRDDTRGRPGEGAQPDQVVYHSDGALVSSLAARQARIDQQRCCILATHELDDPPLPPQELLAGSTGQVHAERGLRLLKAPQFLASSLYLKKPARLMAL